MNNRFPTALFAIEVIPGGNASTIREIRVFTQDHAYTFIPAGNDAAHAFTTTSVGSVQFYSRGINTEHPFIPTPIKNT